MAVKTLDIIGTRPCVGNYTINTLSGTPATSAGHRVAVARESLGDIFLRSIGTTGIFTPGGGAGIGITGFNARTIPGILSGGLAVIKGLAIVIFITVASQAVQGYLIHFSTLVGKGYARLCRIYITCQELGGSGIRPRLIVESWPATYIGIIINTRAFLRTPDYQVNFGIFLS